MIICQIAEPILPVRVAWQVVAPNGQGWDDNIALTLTQATGRLEVSVQPISAAIGCARGMLGWNWSGHVSYSLAPDRTKDFRSLRGYYAILLDSILLLSSFFCTTGRFYFAVGLSIEYNHCTSPMVTSPGELPFTFSRVKEGSSEMKMLEGEGWRVGGVGWRTTHFLWTFLITGTITIVLLAPNPTNPSHHGHPRVYGAPP
jgi:hypothetical protein